MKYTEIDQSIIDPKKIHESRPYQQWIWDLMWKFRDMRCKKGKHQFKNYFGETLSACKWCGELL